MNDNQPYIYALTFPIPDVPGTTATLEFLSWKARSLFIRRLRHGPITAREYRRASKTLED